MKLTFLGTGTSFGVPVVGCRCGTCTSSDRRDRRTRHAAVVQTGEGMRVLVDTPPELRLQLIENEIDRVDAVWFTHLHADHLHGIDDLRVFTALQKRSITAHLSEEYVQELKERFRYIFDHSEPPEGTSKPEISLSPFGTDPVLLGGEEFIPIRVDHPPVSVYGFRVGNLGYITDAKTLDETALGTLVGVRVLVLNALWFGDPHPTHMVVEEAVALSEQLGVEMTYLTHLTHRVSHTELEHRLPPSVRPAFDGLSIEIP